MLVQQVRVVDSQNNDLVFGEHRIYDYKDIRLLNEERLPLHLDIFISDGDSIMEFSLMNDNEVFYLELDSGTTHTLILDIEEREDGKCCGTYYFSQGVSADGVDLGDPQLIVIRQ
ncbi:MAG: hypothetical protein WD077_14730 [Bacteroidia bacterium]